MIATKEPAQEPRSDKPAAPLPMLSRAAYSEEDFPSLRLTRSSRMARRVARWLTVFMAFALAGMVLLPWQQSIVGEGSVVAYDPNERPQSVLAPVKGIVAERGAGVMENAEVKKGQLLFRILDQDPTYLDKLTAQLDNLQKELEANEKLLRLSMDQVANAEGVVRATERQLEAERRAQREAASAADNFVAEARAKLEAERAAVAAAESLVWQTQLDYQRKKDLAADGLESGLKQQEAELKFKEAEQKLNQAKQYVLGAEETVKGKIAQREEKLQEWQGKISKTESELDKALGDVQKSEGEVQKIEGYLRGVRNKLIDQQRKVAVQSTQDVLAPLDGYINRLNVFTEATVVSAKDELAVIVPKTENFAVQLWVDGNDVPFIEPGRHVRLQFEGWPAVQFSGWPSVAVGTFGGTVAIIDPTDDGAGRFRILVKPDVSSDPNDPTGAPWPTSKYLRQGGLAKGWVLLDTVPLGYEVWRRMNGFPQALKNRDSQGEKKDEKIAKPPKVG